jgi:hypothetical protein
MKSIEKEKKGAIKSIMRVVEKKMHKKINIILLTTLLNVKGIIIIETKEMSIREEEKIYLMKKVVSLHQSFEMKKQNKY